MHFKQGTAFQAAHYTPMFVEQCLEISKFLMKYLGEDADEQIIDSIAR
jgi:hypothetical protein